MVTVVDLDPIKALTWALGTFVLSQQTAEYVAPYALIILAAVCGASAALQKKGVTKRHKSFWFMAWCTVLSCLFTVPLSQLAASQVDNWEAQWFFMPMSFLISYKGDRIEALITFGWEAFKTWVSITIHKGKGGPNDPLP